MSLLVVLHHCKGFFLLDFKPELIKADDMVSKEMNRLEEHTSSTTEAYQQLSGPSPNIVRVCFFNVQLHTEEMLKMTHTSTQLPSWQCQKLGSPAFNAV